MRSLISGKVMETILQKELKEVLPDGAKITLNKNTKKDVVLLVTKESHVLGDLLIRYSSNELNANIKAVIGNHEDLRNLVEKFDIPFFCISATNLSRDEHERAVSQKIDEFNPEIIVLAKYMRILSSQFVEKYEGKVLNIHHSFLPAFIGANPYKQAFERGVKIIGATAHYVTNDLDEGPIIFQDVVRVDHSYSWEDMRNAGRNVEKIVLSNGPIIFQDVVRVDHSYSWESMRNAGRNVEKIVLSNAFELLLNDKVFIHKNKTVIL